MAKAEAFNAALTCTTKQLSELFEISDRRIQQLGAENLIVRGAKRGTWVLVASIRGYLRYLREGAQHDMVSDSVYRNERTRKTTNEADLLELRRRLAEKELEIKEGDLVPMSAAKEAITTALTPLRTLLDALPTNTASRCNPSDPVLAEEGIRDAVDQIYRTMDKIDLEKNGK